jgi:signal peptidase I
MTEVLAKILTYGLPFIVLFTGLVWLIDFLFFAKARKVRAAAVEQQFAGKEKKSSAEQQAYEIALQQAATEPAVVEYSKSFFPVLFLVFFIRSFLFEPFQIPSGSMIPTLKIGDFILVNKFTYGIRMPILNKVIIPMNKPQRGEVMVFYPPHQPRVSFIKRVVGLPGDEIRYTNHRLFVNGVEQPYSMEVPDELKDVASIPYEYCSYDGDVFQVGFETLGEHTHATQKCPKPSEYSIDRSWKVPEGYYFMMGDNRDNSLDSRAWGFVSEDQIIGKAMVVWMHWNEFWSIPSFKTVGVIR